MWVLSAQHIALPLCVNVEFKAAALFFAGAGRCLVQLACRMAS
jgi:hypothetical protein